MTTENNPRPRWGELPRDRQEILREVQDSHGELTPLMRTQDQIEAYFKENRGMFSAHEEALVEFLEWRRAKPYLQDDYVKRVEDGDETWTPLPLYRELVLAAAENYTIFAWGKAMDHRGLSAGAAISKLRVWMWLLSDDEAVGILDVGDHYSPYGVPMLMRLCKHFGWPMPDGSTGTHEGGTVGRMMDGLPCCDYCGGCRS